MTSVSSIVLLFCLVGFLAMMYWSQTIQEDRLLKIEKTLVQIKNSLGEKKSLEPTVTERTEKKKKKRSYWDSSLPNLLTEDAFYTKTLPKLLPPHFVPHGTLRSETIGTFYNLLPFSQWADVIEWENLCTGSLAQNSFGKYYALSPDLAIKIDERTSSDPKKKVYYVHLRDNLFWQPLQQEHFPNSIRLSEHFLKKHPVTAEDFVFYFQAYTNPYNDQPTAVTLRQLIPEVENVKALDDLTLEVTVKLIAVQNEDGTTSYQAPYSSLYNIAGLKPLARFVYQYLPDGSKICPDDESPNFYQRSSFWAQNFIHHFSSRIIVSCGAFIFDGIDEKKICFKRNQEYFNPVYALYNSVEIHFFQTYDAIWRDFQSQKIDACTLSPEHLIELDRFLKSDYYAKLKKENKSIKVLDYIRNLYFYIAWNERNPRFTNPKVRQALDYAIDRPRIIKQGLNGSGVEVTGPFSYTSPSYDHSLQPRPYDPEKAKLLLDEAGWTKVDKEGIRQKTIDGKNLSFSFTVIYYVHNTIGKAIVQIVQENLKQVGIDCVLCGVDIADLNQQVMNKSFDALYLGWGASSPPENPRQLWHSEGAKEKGSSNLTGLINKDVDKLIEKLEIEHDEKTREDLYHQFHRLIYNLAPYSFLFNEKVKLVYWNDLKGIFIPKDRQDLIPGAQVQEPNLYHGWKA